MSCTHDEGVSRKLCCEEKINDFSFLDYCWRCFGNFVCYKHHLFKNQKAIKDDLPFSQNEFFSACLFYLCSDAINEKKKIPNSLGTNGMCQVGCSTQLFGQKNGIFGIDAFNGWEARSAHTGHQCNEKVSTWKVKKKDSNFWSKNVHHMYLLWTATWTMPITSSLVWL